MAGPSSTPSTEVKASFVLLAATVLALALANGGLAVAYKAVLGALVLASGGRRAVPAAADALAARGAA